MNSHPNQDMKYELVDAVESLLRDDVAKSRLKVEVSRVAPLQVQVKVYPDAGMPRYFTVRVSEAL